MQSIPGQLELLTLIELCYVFETHSQGRVTAMQIESEFNGTNFFRVKEQMNSIEAEMVLKRYQMTQMV